MARNFQKNKIIVMVLSSFIVGAFASTVTSILIYEKLRDRRFLFEKKFNENDISEYIYKAVCCIKYRFVLHHRYNDIIFTHKGVTGAYSTEAESERFNFREGKQKIFQ